LVAATTGDAATAIRNCAKRFGKVLSDQTSVTGQKPKSLHLSGVSVAPSGADIRRLAQHGRKVPKADGTPNDIGRPMKCSGAMPNHHCY